MGHPVIGVAPEQPAMEGVGTLAIDLQTVLGLPDGDADTGQFMLEGGKAICFVAANVCDPTNTGRALGKGRDCGYHGGELARLVQVDVNRLEGIREPPVSWIPRNESQQLPSWRRSG